jgi:hypothetical protein
MYRGQARNSKTTKIKYEKTQKQINEIIGALNKH